MGAHKSETANKPNLKEPHNKRKEKRKCSFNQLDLCREKERKEINKYIAEIAAQVVVEMRSNCAPSCTAYINVSSLNYLRTAGDIPGIVFVDVRKVFPI